MRCLQQTLCRSDFDISFSPDLRPACRVLLPEHVSAQGLENAPAVVHAVGGAWRVAGDVIEGSFRPTDEIEIGVTLGDGGDAALVTIAFRNLGKNTWRDLQSNVCVAMNHLPGSGGHHWANGDFIPESLPLDRSEHGRYWYSRLAPQNYKGLSAGGWVTLHPDADDPRCDKVQPYPHLIGEARDVIACAVKAPGQDLFLFQTWDAPCRRHSPFWGNACTHLQQCVAPMVAPGETAVLAGRIGLFRGDWSGLAEHISRGQWAWENAKPWSGAL
ncbi:MAG: hypothetical protein ABFD92_12730 [Planctomycetaceae bacterium]|nr:hypothetical protein [Planctomycetaceae bacterium]